MDDSAMLEALELLVDREGQRGAARLLGVNRGTVADWVKRDTMTPRMRDAIERGLRGIRRAPGSAAAAPPRRGP